MLRLRGVLHPKIQEDSVMDMFDYATIGAFVYAKLGGRNLREFMAAFFLAYQNEDLEEMQKTIREMNVDA